NRARSDWSRLAVPNQTPVGFDHRNNLRSRASEITFVRDENIMPGDVGFHNFDPEFPGNLEHNRSSDSAQGPGRDGRGKYLTALNDENVIGSAFVDVSRVIQHKRFVLFRPVRLDPRL